MSKDSKIVGPGPRAGTVRGASGEVLTVPEGWELLPSGDAGLTRKVKSGGSTWTVRVKRGRREISVGVWAPTARIVGARAAIEAQRASPEYQRRQQGAKRRRDDKQAAYVREFQRHVVAFLDFDERFKGLAGRLAQKVAAQATPVGSGTVARTARIPVHERAEAAVIAWLRHETTLYDSMSIARVKGHRREVRRQLARQSRALLQSYRNGADVAPGCPLQRALAEPVPRDSGMAIATVSAEATPATPTSVPTAPEPTVKPSSPPAAKPFAPSRRPVPRALDEDEVAAKRRASAAAARARWQRKRPAK